MRLFVALMPPDEVIDELRANMPALRRLGPGLRWTRPEQWHLTLAFLGDVDDRTIAELGTRLARAAARHTSLLLSLGGGGRFGHRVLWAGVQGDRIGLRKLADSVRAAARRSDLPVEQGPYRPHLTLARATGPADLRPLAQQLASYTGQPWVATRLDLVSSRLGAGPDGTPRYESTASWPLGG